MRLLMIMVMLNIHTVEGMDVHHTLVSDTLTSVIDSICPGFAYYTPEGKEYITEGTYIDTFPLGPTCDSIRILILNTMQKAPTIVIDESYCYDEPGIPQDGTYTSEGEGCDPDTILNVTVFPQQPPITRNHIMCEGQTYTWEVNDLEYSEPGTYVDTIPDANGCDRLAVLSLATRPVPPFPTSDTIVCSTTFDDYPVGTTPVFHCDSIFYVTVVDYDPITYSDSIWICDGQSYMGKDATGSYLIEMPTPEGCKDLLVLHLKVEGANVETNESATICHGESYNGYSDSGIYIDSLLSVDGCDSINTLELTVLPVTTGYDSTYCADPLDPNEPLPGSYVTTEIDSNGCSIENILTVYAGTINSSIDTMICEGEEYLGYTDSGVYTVDQLDNDGCPYEILLTLEVIPIADCNVAADDPEIESVVRISPNPAKDIIEITTDRKNVVMDVINSNGKLVIKGTTFNQSTSLDISEWSRGIYFIQLNMDDKEQITKKLSKI